MDGVVKESSHSDYDLTPAGQLVCMRGRERRRNVGMSGGSACQARRRAHVFGKQGVKRRFPKPSRHWEGFLNSRLRAYHLGLDLDLLVVMCWPDPACLTAPLIPQADGLRRPPLQQAHMTPTMLLTSTLYNTGEWVQACFRYSKSCFQSSRPLTN